MSEDVTCTLLYTQFSLQCLPHLLEAFSSSSSPLWGRTSVDSCAHTVQLFRKSSASNWRWNNNCRHQLPLRIKDSTANKVHIQSASCALIFGDQNNKEANVPCNVFWNLFTVTMSFVILKVFPSVSTVNSLQRKKKSLKIFSSHCHTRAGKVVNALHSLRCLSYEMILLKAESHSHNR